MNARRNKTREKERKKKPDIEINKYEMFKLNIVSMTKSQAHRNTFAG